MFSRPTCVVCVVALAATACAQGKVTADAVATTAPATTEAPSQIALEEAEKQYSTLRGQVITAITQYEQVVDAFNESAGIDDQATNIVDAVAATFGDTVNAAHHRWEQAKDALANWDGNATTIKQLGEELEKAGEAMKKADQEFAKETHEEYEREGNTMKHQATSPGDQLEKQAGRLKKERDVVEKAQRKAGVKERVYEKESLSHEKEAEHLKLRVERAKERSERKVERFFGRVEKQVDGFEGRVRHAGGRFEHEVKEELNNAEKNAKTEADKKDGSDNSDASTTPARSPKVVALAQVDLTVGVGVAFSLFALSNVALFVMGLRSQRRRFWITSPAERPLLG